MAGILFTDDKFVLGGYSHHKQSITGIGGKKVGNETPPETALRETLEELFEFIEIPETLTRLASTVLPFNNLMSRGGYTTFIMDFNDLSILLNTLSMVPGLKSNVYDVLPKNINELVMNRKAYPSAEFSHIVLLPCETLDIDRSFKNDIIHLKTVN